MSTMNGFVAGVWETDAPIDHLAEQAARQRLDLLMAHVAKLSGLTIRSATVWIDGVEWEYRSQLVRTVR